MPRSKAKQKSKTSTSAKKIKDKTSGKKQRTEADLELSDSDHPSQAVGQSDVAESRPSSPSARSRNSSIAKSDSSYRTPSQPENDDFEPSDLDQDEHVVGDDYKESALHSVADATEAPRAKEAEEEVGVVGGDSKESAPDFVGREIPEGSPDCVITGEQAATSPARSKSLEK